MKPGRKLKKLQKFVDRNKNSLNEMLNEMAAKQGVEVEDLDMNDLDCDEYLDDYISAMALLDQLSMINEILNK